MKLATFFISIAAWAQLQPPQLGVMLDASGAVRPVYGVAASVTAGDPIESGVVSSACSSRLCLFKTQSAIVSSGTRAAAPDGSALFALNGTSAFIYFPHTRQFFEWQNGNLTPINLNVTGEILSLTALAGGSLQFAVLRNGVISIVDQNDNVLGSVPGSGPAMLSGGDVIYADSGMLVLRRGDAAEFRWPLASIEGFSALGDGCIQIHTATGSFALRLIPGREQLFMLPEKHR